MPQIKTKKISELDEAQSYDGLQILATNSNNESKRFAFGDFAKSMQKQFNDQSAINEEFTAFIINMQSSSAKEVVTVADYSYLATLPDDQKTTEKIYKTEDENKLYVWNETDGFIEVTNAALDSTIYTTDINSLVSMSLEQGIYNVLQVGKKYEDCVIQRISTNQAARILGQWLYLTARGRVGYSDAINTAQTAYLKSLTISLKSLGIEPTDSDLTSLRTFANNYGIIYQINYAQDNSSVSNAYTLIITSSARTLTNQDGYATVANNAWNWHYYSFDRHTHTTSDIADFNEAVAALLPDKSNTEKDVIEVENEEALSEIDEPQTETIYITADENKLFIWNGEEFIEVTNTATSDNTIYVRTLGSLLDMTFSRGIYTVCATKSSLAGGRSINYTLVVNTATSRTRQQTTQTLYLSNKDGWADVDLDENDEPYWNWHFYAYQTEEGENLEYAEESDVEMLEPLPSDMVTEIVNGEFDPSDIAPFTGTTEYRAMTRAEVTAIIQSVFNSE